MNEKTDKSAPCTAIAQKRAHRPGGCVGIFFQLFDWNRRFAKKKLFSRKSLASGDARQASKRFGENEKMLKSKLHLIADENRGLFSNPKKSSDFLGEHSQGKNEIKAPGLVARLMGLETMPAIKRDKHKKLTSSRDKCTQKEEKPVNNVVGKEDLSLERSRPQKLQKTGVSDRRIVSRIGSEALQIKNVLSRSRKHHHHRHQKLPLPVRSPRLSTAKRNSRLIHAAARILEPGVQKASNRAKCALTYTDSLHQRAVDGIETNGFGVFSTECGYNATSCKICGSLVSVEKPFVVNDAGKPFGYPSFIDNSINNSFQDEGKYSTDHFKLSFDRELKGAVNCDQSESRPVRGNKEHPAIHQTRGLFASKNEVEAEKPILRGERFPQEAGLCKLRTECRQYELEAEKPILRGEGFPREASLCKLRSRRASSDMKAVSGMYKNVTVLSRGSSSGIPPRFPKKTEKFGIGMERNSCTSLEGSALKLPVGKRRIPSINIKEQNAGNVGPTAEKRTICDSVRTNGDVERNALFHASEFPIIKKAGFRRGQKEGWEENHLRTPKQKQGIKDDVFRVLSLHKFKELESSCQEVDERPSRDSLVRKSTPMILRDRCYSSDINTPFRASGKQEMDTRGFDGYSDYMSPGSVFDASFSNESCFSSSFDDRSGGRLCPDSTDRSYDRSQPSKWEIDLLEDSVASFKAYPLTSAWTNNCLDGISCLLDGVNETGIGLTQFQAGHAKEVLSNTELLFGTRDSFIIPSLLDELQILANVVCEFSDFPNVLTRAFLLDCVVEHFNSRYDGCIYSAFEAWKKLSLPVDLEMLAKEVLEEVMSWEMFCELPLNEIIMSEIEQFLVQWNVSDAEGFKVGVEICSSLLHGLIGEVVMDLVVCS